MIARLSIAAVLMLAACASAPAREAFSVEALVADAPGYVASFYRESELPAALIADLEAEEFQCQHSATVSECGRSRRAFATCWDVITVRIEAARVTAAQNRRCMGANP